MQKTMTKEELAAKLDGREYRGGMPSEIVEAAKKNNLVILHGASDDLLELYGAITEETGVCTTLLLTRSGIPESDCKDENCPYFRRWMESALKRGEAKTVRVYWGGESGGKTMDPAEYEAIGKPTWCFETEMVHATFSVYDTYGDDREYFCRGIVLDLKEVFPSRSYEQMVM